MKIEGKTRQSTENKQTEQKRVEKSSIFIFRSNRLDFIERIFFFQAIWQPIIPHPTSSLGSVSLTVANLMEPSVLSGPGEACKPVTLSIVVAQPSLPMIVPSYP